MEAHVMGTREFHAKTQRPAKHAKRSRLGGFTFFG